ncbi:MAG: HD-GYP domain-containing protein [Phycisphaerales bacterium]
MLLCNLNEVAPGMRVGAAVLCPRSPDRPLLKPGAELTTSILRLLRDRGVHQLWISDGLSEDLDNFVDESLTAAKMRMFEEMKTSFRDMNERTLCMSHASRFRNSIMELVTEAMSSRLLGSLTDPLFQSDASIMSHSANVAYLAVLLGLDLETYIVRCRSRLAPSDAFDLVSLGLAAMMHDIGKSGAGGALDGVHEAHLDDDDEAPEGYRGHTREGYDLLRASRLSASAKQAILNHHQRFDGNGWSGARPVQRRPAAEGDDPRRQAGDKIHIFTRIVSVANTLDNLMRSVDGSPRPAVAALFDLASERFNGWFDPVVRAVALRRIMPFGVGSKVRLSDGRDAVVVAPNASEPCWPFVRPLDKGPQLTKDSEQNATMNLAETPGVWITHAVGCNVEPWLFRLADRDHVIRIAAAA